MYILYCSVHSTICSLIFVALGFNIQNYLSLWNLGYSYISLQLLPKLVSSLYPSIPNIPPNTTIILQGCIIGTNSCLVFQNSNGLRNLNVNSTLSFLSAFIQPIIQCAPYNVSALIYVGSAGCYQVYTLPQLSVKISRNTIMIAFYVCNQFVRFFYFYFL